MRPFLAALLLLPATGLAQSGIVLTLNGAGTSGVLARNASGCSTIVAGSWTGTGLTAACTSLQFWVTSSPSACGAAPSTTNVPADFVITTVPSSSLTTGTVTQGPYSFNFTSLPSFSTSGNSCGAVVDFTNYICAGVTLTDTTGACQGAAVTGTPVLSVRYDNIPPDPPLLSITPLDGQLSVRLSPSDTSDTISGYNVQFAVEPPDGGTANFAPACGTIAANNPVCTISGLVNGTNYLVQGYSIDEATNSSGPSTPPTVGTPVVTLGFYSNYINDGGKPAGGCGDAAGGGPSALALATVLLLGLVRRRG
jgi:hypothetical protein